VFISIDGIEGSGKSSQVRLLSKWMRENKIDHVSTKEPGAIISKECLQIRQLLLSPENNITPRAELWLFLADRSQHIDQVILPALNSGKWVVSDRYSDSTKVYQGFARGLNSDIVNYMVNYASYELNPNLTFILDLPVEIGLDRAKKSNTEFFGGDRVELEDLSFHKKLREGFLELSKTHERYVVIDANKSIDEIHREIIKEIGERIV